MKVQELFSNHLRPINLSHLSCKFILKIIEWSISNPSYDWELVFNCSNRKIAISWLWMVQIRNLKKVLMMVFTRRPSWWSNMEFYQMKSSRGLDSKNVEVFTLQTHIIDYISGRRVKISINNFFRFRIWTIQSHVIVFFRFERFHTDFFVMKPVDLPETKVEDMCTSMIWHNIDTSLFVDIENKFVTNIDFTNKCSNV